jgi:Family of unknown function (DUF5343)
MASKLPYVNQPGSVVKVFEKVRQAQTPERFTGDFLETKLGFRGGNYKQFIPFAKKLGFLGTDGVPSEIYKRFRNEGTTKSAMAEAVKIGYKELFERNEHADAMRKEDFKGLVVEVTGLDSKSRVVVLICSTFDALLKIADFNAKPSGDAGKTEVKSPTGDKERNRGGEDIDLNLSYTINLVLPKTDDAAVFTAIFKSLRENLLRK